MGFTGILLEESKDEAARMTLSAIHRNGEHLLTLLNDVLDLSKIEAGAVCLNTTTFDLAENLRDLYDMMQIRAADMKRTLTFHCPEPLPKTVTTDAARLRQVLVNIIGNGLKFAPDGTVDVSITLLTDSPACRDVALPALQIEVADNGIGIEAEQIDRLFKPFTQANASIAQRFGGTGLGLSISKRLIESLGGTIDVESEKGIGSTFSICVPVGPIGETVAIQPSAPRSSSVENDPPPVSSINDRIEAHVLIADDMRDIRYIARHFLRKAGCTVDIAENGRDAVDRVAQSIGSERPYNIILMDMQMPIMGGERAMEEVRKLGFHAPIVALTADAMKGTRQRLLDAGFDAYLTKPVRAGKLLATVKSLLSQSQPQR